MIKYIIAAIAVPVNVFIGIAVMRGVVEFCFKNDKKWWAFPLFMTALLCGSSALAVFCFTVGAYAIGGLTQ